MMQPLQRIFSLLLLLLLPVAPGWAGLAFHQDQLRIPAGESLDDEIWFAGQEAEIAGEARADVFLLGKSLNLSGQFNQACWGLADAAAFSGEAREDVRLLCRTADLNGQCDGTLMVAANTILLRENTQARGITALAAENVIIEGDLAGPVYAFGAKVTLGGHCHGNVRVWAQDIVVSPGTVIEGDLVYTAPNELFLNPEVQLKGQLLRREYTALTDAPTAPVSFGQTMSVALFFYLAAVLAGIPFVGIFPYYSGRAVRLLRTSSFKCLLVGFLAFALMPMLAVFLGLLIIGLPLACMLLAVYVLFLYLAKIVVGLALGSLMARTGGPQSMGRVWGSLGIGLLIIFAAAQLPIIGLFVSIAVVLLGLGALVLAVFQGDVITVGIRPPPPPPGNEQTL